VQGRKVPLAPVEVGVLGSLDVELLQEVRRGQVVARMDAARLRAEVATVSAEIEAVRQELALEIAARQQGAATDRHRFATDVDRARLRVLEIIAVLEPDRVTLADLERDVASYRELLAQEMVSVREYERVQSEHDALARRVQEHEHLLAAARAELTQAEQRWEQYVARHGELSGGEQALVADRALASRITALERELELVLLRQDDLTLTAPFDGVITQILASPGQVLRPGEVVLTVAESQPQRIVVWLDEASVRRLEQRGDLEATLSQVIAGKTVRVHCEVARIGSTIETKPLELWRAPERPESGRPVVLGVPAGVRLVPGGKVTVRWG
jgi:multidrug resistance efflux pump